MSARRKHGPNRLANYLDTHETVIQQFVSRGFVVGNELEFSAFGDNRILLTGALRCPAGIVVEVRKILEVSGSEPDPRVQTVAYSYNVRLQGVGNIVRYDNPHRHRPMHHVHRFDVFRGDRAGRIDAIGDDEWPTLGELLSEVEEWYYANLDRLGHQT